MARTYNEQAVQSQSTSRLAGTMKWLYRSLALAALGVGGVGIALPLLPTTPFVLIAAWAAAKGSPKLHRWIHAHPRFGPLVRQWQQERAIPQRAKVSAVVLIAASWLIILLTIESAVAVIVAGIVMLGVSAFLVSRPHPIRSYESYHAPGPR